jgi:hypothetical protein
VSDLRGVERPVRYSPRRRELEGDEELACQRRRRYDEPALKLGSSGVARETPSARVAADCQIHHISPFVL